MRNDVPGGALPRARGCNHLWARVCARVWFPRGAFTVAKPPLSLTELLTWADRHRRLTGRWPTAASGPVGGAPGETWQALNRALVRGSRGLPGGTSLAAALAEYRGRRNKAAAPPLREEQ